MSKFEDLEKLAELKKKKIITEEEFEKKKQALLASSYNPDENATSPKSRTVYGVLGFLLGLFGVHNFYLGRKIQGFFQAFVWILLLVGLILPSPAKKIIFIICGFGLIIQILVIPIWVGLNLLLTQRDGKKRLMKQEGKTLCTVLGIIMLVLGIGGGPALCSIGGLAGYTMAMNRHQANQILDYVSRCAIAAQVKGDGYTIAGDTCGNLLTYDVAPNGLNAGSFVVSAAGRYDDRFKITTPVIDSEDTRSALIDRSNINVSISKTYDNRIEFIFRK